MTTEVYLESNLISETATDPLEESFLLLTGYRVWSD